MKEPLSQEEWEQLVELRAELNGNLMAYDPVEVEKFVELLVKSLEGKGDCRPVTVSPTFGDGLPSLPAEENTL